MLRRLLVALVYIIVVKLLTLNQLFQFTNNRDSFHPFLIDTNFIGEPDLQKISQGFLFVLIVVVISRVIIYFLRITFNFKPITDGEHIAISGTVGFLAGVAGVLTVGYISYDRSFSFLSGFNLFIILIIGGAFLIMSVIANSAIALILTEYNRLKKN